MGGVYKLTCWVIIIGSLWGIILPNLNEENIEIDFKESASLNSLQNNSKTIFFIGSSRVMMGINTDLLNDSLPEWKSINLGVSGSSLAQNLYLANLLKNKAGSKILFIELSRYKINRLNTALVRVLGLSNYTDSYNEYVYTNPYLLEKVKNWEGVFWDWLINKQNNIKQLISNDNKLKYQVIGFAPNYTSGYRKTDSFVTEKDMLRFSNEPIDTETMGRINELLTAQVKGKCRLIFLLPVTTMEKNELKFSIPIFHSIPLNNKWNYNPSFIKAISQPKYLADKNHLNYQGSVIYTQGLLKYIKSNEASWQ